MRGDGPGAVSIFETPPFIRRRMDDRVRELVMSRMEPDLAAIISISRSARFESRQ
jgi:hypothetical protein